MIFAPPIGHLLGLCPLYLSPLSLFIYLLFDSSLKLAWSPFKNSNYLLNYFLNILGANWKVSSSNFMLYLYLFGQWCAIEAILLEWISHQENLENLKDEIKFNKEIWFMIYFTHGIVHSQLYFLH
jgi:hypothetical protein